MATLGGLISVGIVVVVVQARGIKPRERLMARCEGMFERMPDTFPPKRLMRGIEETRADTARILELLEGDQQTVDTAHAPEAAAR